MADGPDLARRAAEWAGVPWDSNVERLLTRYVVWLGTEALPAGGLGPAEGERLWSRHIADSLLFAGCWPERRPPRDLLDVGSGVGLPGIPLAIVWPETAVTLLDRSETRARLARRAIRLLGIRNVGVVVADAGDHGVHYDLVVLRAAFPPAEALRIGAEHGRPGGTVAVGLTHRSEGEPDSVVHAEVVLVPEGVLDSPTRLLRMTIAGG